MADPAPPALRLAAETIGTGPPIIILHGLFGSGRNWSAIARALAERFRVISPDLRNHGDSPHSPVMSYAAMAADLNRFIDEEANGPVPVIGHSMGGKAAMVLALTRPQQVARLMVIDIAPVDYGVDHGRTGFAAYIAAMQAVPLDTLKRRQDAVAHLAGAIADPAIRAFLLQNLIRNRHHGWQWRLNLPVIAGALGTIGGFPDLAPRHYDGRTGFLAGGRSDYIRPDHRAAIRGYFPAAQWGRVAGAGHWVHADAPQRVTRIIADFLA